MFVIIGGQQLTLTPVKFTSIKENDTVAHLVENEDGTKEIWVGVTQSLAQNEDTWYGNGRKHATATGDTWTDFTHDTREDINIVAKWHAELPEHSIWLVS